MKSRVEDKLPRDGFYFSSDCFQDKGLGFGTGLALWHLMLQGQRHSFLPLGHNSRAVLRVLGSGLFMTSGGRR